MELPVLLLLMSELLRSRNMYYAYHKQYNNIRGGSRINFRVLQNFTKKIEQRNDVICRKIIDSARSKKVQF